MQLMEVIVMLKNEKIETLREELNQLIINGTSYDEILKKSQELDELLNDEKNENHKIKNFRFS